MNDQQPSQKHQLLQQCEHLSSVEQSIDSHLSVCELRDNKPSKITQISLQSTFKISNFFNPQLVSENQGDNFLQEHKVDKDILLFLNKTQSCSEFSSNSIEITPKNINNNFALEISSNNQTLSPLPIENLENFSNYEQQPQAQPAYNANDISSEISKSIKQAKMLGHLLNILLGSISFSKIIMFTYTIFKYHSYSSSTTVNYYWILSVLIYDIFYIFYLILSSICMCKCKEQELICEFSSQDEDIPLANFYSSILEEIFLEIDPINLIKVQSNAERKYSFVLEWGEICRVTYIIIFNFGLFSWKFFLISSSGDEQQQQSQSKDEYLLRIDYLGQLFMIFGSIYLFIPFISYIIFPFVIAIWICFQQYTTFSPLPANSKQINSLLVCKFQNLLIQQTTSYSQECSICQSEYQKDDLVVTLPCNNLHYFHEDCGKKWLEMKPYCPICRQSIADKAQDSK